MFGDLNELNMVTCSYMQLFNDVDDYITYWGLITVAPFTNMV